MRLATLVVTTLAFCGVADANGQTLTPKALDEALAAKPVGADAAALADRIRTYFGGNDVLVKGAPPKIDELAVAWAIDATPV
jgi:hypothetical protein